MCRGRTSTARRSSSARETGAGSVADLPRFDHPLGYVYDPALTEHDGSVTRLTFVESV